MILFDLQLSEKSSEQTRQNNSCTIFPERYYLFQENKQIYILAAAAAKLLQSCPTLCDPTDSSPLGSPIPGILQARTLEWVAISFSNAWK